MSNISIDHSKIQDIDSLLLLCPFNAIEKNGEKIEITAACRMCGLCLKKQPLIFRLEVKTRQSISKDDYSGIAVFVEYDGEKIHPVSLELIGKAKQLAQKSNQSVEAVVVGYQTENAVEELLFYGVDVVFVYDDKQLSRFKIEPFTAVFEDYILKNKPSIVLMGGTVVGRSLAPRLAARFKTGLTADCTVLDIDQSGDLDQIRPAFGGNVMAHINTPNHRPQFATVRYKIFETPKKSNKPSGETVHCSVSNIDVSSKLSIIETKLKPKTKSIEDAEVIVVAGAGVKDQLGLDLINELAVLLNGTVASTRYLIEKGVFDARLQIGLSGRTVRPKLIITCGVSGSIQFVAGMSGASTIIAINQDKNASIFKVAHFALVGDLYEILPQLIQNIKKGASV